MEIARLSRSVVRILIRSTLGLLLVSLTALVEIELRLSNGPSACSLMIFTFVILATCDRHWTALIGVVAGSLEQLLILSGGALSVGDFDDALGIITCFSTGLILVWLSRSARADQFAVHQDLQRAYEAELRAGDRLHELAHRLANDFSMLVSAAGIIGRRSDHEETRRAMNELSERVVVLGRVYRRLSNGKKSDGAISMGCYLGELCEDLRLARFTQRPISIELQIQDIILPSHSAALVGIITNELLANVDKHAFPEGQTGQIIVALRRAQPDMIVLDVIDDGVGSDKPVTQSGGIGHRLIVSLAAQLGGAISFTRNDAKTIVSLSFPEEQAHEARIARARQPLSSLEKHTASAGRSNRDSDGARPKARKSLPITAL